MQIFFKPHSRTAMLRQKTTLTTFISKKAPSQRSICLQSLLGQRPKRADVMQDTGVNFLTSVRPSLPKSKSCSTRPEISVKRLKSTLSDLFSSPRSKMKNAKSASLDPKSALFSPESALLDHKSTLPERGAQRTTTTELVLPDMSESPRILVIEINMMYTFFL